MSDIHELVDKFQNALLLARPRDAYKFAVRYFGDGRCADPEEAHAVHLLPFLVFDKDAFTSAACTVYCRNLMAAGRCVSRTSGNSTSNSKGFLDGDTVRDIIDRMNLESLRLRCKVVEEMLDERLQLRVVDFDLFVSCLRFPLVCFQVVLWVEEELCKCRATHPSTVSSNDRGAGADEAACAGISQYGVVELHKVKAHLQKCLAGQVGGGGSTGSGNSLRTSRGSSSPMSSSASASPSAASHAGRGSTSSVRSSGCSNMHNSSRYHMHPHEWAEAELRLFYRLLAAVVEDRISGDTAASEGNPNHASVASLVSEFMTRYMRKVASSAADTDTVNAAEK